jgi:hypothetical protein
VTERLERMEARRYGKMSAPRKALSSTDLTPSSRHVPAAVRRAVHEHDGARCAYRDGKGRRCPATVRLEFHHRRPFAMGGDHDPRNIGLLSRAHNRYVAELDYGRSARDRRATPAPSDSARGG